MAKLMSVNFVVPDDFELGQCIKCPLNIDKPFTNTCILEYNKDNCPLYYHIPRWDEEEYDFEITD